MDARTVADSDAQVESRAHLSALHAIAIFRNGIPEERCLASRRPNLVDRAAARATTANRCASALSSARGGDLPRQARHRRVNARTRARPTRASYVRSKTFSRRRAPPAASVWRSSRRVGARRAARAARLRADTHRSNHAEDEPSSAAPPRDRRAASRFVFRPPRPPSSRKERERASSGESSRATLLVARLRDASSPRAPRRTRAPRRRAPRHGLYRRFDRVAFVRRSSPPRGDDSRELLKVHEVATRRARRARAQPRRASRRTPSRGARGSISPTPNARVPSRRRWRRRRRHTEMGRGRKSTTPKVYSPSARRAPPPTRNHARVVVAATRRARHRTANASHARTRAWWSARRRQRPHAAPAHVANRNASARRSNALASASPSSRHARNGARSLYRRHRRVAAATAFAIAGASATRVRHVSIATTDARRSRRKVIRETPSRIVARRRASTRQDEKRRDVMELLLVARKRTVAARLSASRVVTKRQPAKAANACARIQFRASANARCVTRTPRSERTPAPRDVVTETSGDAECRRARTSDARRLRHNRSADALGELHRRASAVKRWSAWDARRRSSSARAASVARRHASKATRRARAAWWADGHHDTRDVASSSVSRRFDASGDFGDPSSEN